MGSKHPSKKRKGKTKQIKSSNYLSNIKSKYIIKQILELLHKKNLLTIFKYNKATRNLLNITSDDYKKYTEIELEMEVSRYRFGKFINYKEEDKSYYHIYFNNNNKEEIERNYLNENEKVSNIKIIIDYQVKSFNELFKDCKCIETINFKNLITVELII